MPCANMSRAAPDKITESMDQALADIGVQEEPFLSTAARRRLEQVEW